jgi:hypothetical protein
VRTDRYIGSVIEYAHSAMADDFDTTMMTISAANPDRFHHVYEPGHVGIKQFQLWDHTILGRGKKRQASWNWRPSVLPILSPQERHNDPEDPMSQVSEEDIAKLNDREYIFYQRAPIMEYRLRVNITPVNAKFLFIPTFKTNYHKGAKGEGYKAAHYRFAKHNVPNWDFRNPQEPSGGEGTVGQFTAQWVAYWNGGGADAAWDMHVRETIEKGLGASEAEMAKATRFGGRMRRRSKTFSIATFNDSAAAFESGANLARAFIKGQAASYSKASKWIDEHGLFGNEAEF